MRKTTGSWTNQELAVLNRLPSPEKIQAFLDRLAYNTDPEPRPPRGVLKRRRAHCFDGALFAAAALRRLGHPPLLMDLRAVRDDDHVLAIFRRRSCFGAVAKSNFSGLRFREPVYRTLRELAMSYFEQYYNLRGEKTLRERSAPLDLRRFDRLNWTFDNQALPIIEEQLNSIRHYPLLTPAMIASLGQVDRRSYRAGMLGTVKAGLYRP